jgi:hypothetical protein
MISLTLSCLILLAVGMLRKVVQPSYDHKAALQLMKIEREERTKPKFSGFWSWGGEQGGSDSSGVNAIAAAG